MMPLPIDAVLGALKAALGSGAGAVLQAPPGSGKTTRVPLALLDELWLAGRRIVMLEPRRLAARAAAAYMAGLLGEPVGRTVGYRVRMDTRVGPQTRIEVVTEGVLTRLMQRDASLAGTGLVIFDEFHERHLEADLGLALCLDLQGVLNPGLKILVMSATMETGPVAALLGAAPVIACEGRLFEVETRYAGRGGGQPLEREVAAAVHTAAATEAGSILAFLPGAPEIRRVLALLQASRLGPEWMLAPLFGNLTRAEQDRAIAPAPAGRRKIVLATNIAETSLTIEGIRVVVDSGFARAPRFDVRSGMTRLVTLPVSRASADQRRGRAGRTEPGVCIRLGSEEAHGSLAPRNTPEILQADLATLALEVAAWGVDSPGRLRWLDPPPAAAFDQARQLLCAVGALDGAGAVTRHGRRMAELPMHPRLAHMVLAAMDAGAGAAACDLAALLSERDFVSFASGEPDSDLRLRLEIVHDLREGKRPEASRSPLDRAACRRVIRLAEEFRRRLELAAQDAVRIEAGRLLAWAYPDRIGQRRAGASGRYLLTNGRGAFFSAPEPLSGSDYIVAADLDGERCEARIFLAAAYDLATLLDQYAGQVHTRTILDWDARRQMVVAERELRLGALVLKSEPLSSPDPAGIASALIKGITLAGIGCLPWTQDARRWQARVMFVRRVGAGGPEWPDVSDSTLIGSLEEWLGAHLSGITRLADLKKVDLHAALAGMLDWRQRRALDELAPTHLTVPSGSRIRLDYSGETPVLAVRIQEMFGGTGTPRVGGGSQPVLLHLLSPAGRPMQVTADLAGFWTRGYPEVKRDLKGRYPKHSWPDDPLQAKPTSGRKKDSNYSGR